MQRASAVTAQRRQKELTHDRIGTARGTRRDSFPSPSESLRVPQTVPQRPSYPLYLFPLFVG